MIRKYNINEIKNYRQMETEAMLCVCVTLLLFVTVDIVSTDESEYRLIQDLMRNYDPRIRPSINASESLNVTFGLALAQIIDVVCTHDLCIIIISVGDD